MATVQEMLAAIEARNQRPINSVMQNIVAGYQQAQAQKLDRVMKLMAIDQARRQMEEQEKMRKELAAQEENAVNQGVRIASTKPAPVLPSQKMMVEYSQDEKGNISKKWKPQKEEGSDLDRKYKETQIALNEKKLSSKEKPTPYETQRQKDEAKKISMQPKEAKLLSSTESKFDSMIKEAEAIRDNPALDGAVGANRLAGAIPGTAAYDVKSRINTLKSKTAFSVLQDMRASSPTGGALGAVSDRENQMLQDNVSTLDTGQSIKAFKESLNRIIETARESKKRLRASYEDFYGDINSSGAEGESSSSQSSDDDPLGLFK